MRKGKSIVVVVVYRCSFGDADVARGKRTRISRRQHRLQSRRGLIVIIAVGLYIMCCTGVVVGEVSDGRHKRANGKAGCKRFLFLKSVVSCMPRGTEEARSEVNVCMCVCVPEEE
jgi:hypothetical protein